MKNKVKLMNILLSLVVLLMCFTTICAARTIEAGTEYTFNVSSKENTQNLTFTVPEENDYSIAVFLNNVDYLSAVAVVTNHFDVTLTDASENNLANLRFMTLARKKEFSNLEAVNSPLGLPTTASYPTNGEKNKLYTNPVHLAKGNYSIKLDNIAFASAWYMPTLETAPDIDCPMNLGIGILCGNESIDKFAQTGELQNSSALKPENPDGSRPVYRLYNTVSQEHLYTPASEEVEALKKIGWRDEGTGWTAPANGVAVYRLYNPALGDHLYTSDKNEVTVLTTQRGWISDFNGEPIFYSDGNKPVYRLYYSPNLRHLLTTDKNEYDTLQTYGWEAEGIALYGVN